ncbi:MAG: Arm DNA-binding domain-containing protein, partial [Thiobacillaceae bacterium]
MARQPPITDRHVRALLIRPGRHRADRRLYLFVKPTGAASWVFRYLGKDGKSHDLGLGPYPAVSLAEARAQAAKLSAELAHGIDPVTQRRREKGAAAFRVVAEALIAAKRPGWKNAKHAMQWENTLRDY